MTDPANTPLERRIAILENEAVVFKHVVANLTRQLVALSEKIETLKS